MPLPASENKAVGQGIFRRPDILTGTERAGMKDRRIVVIDGQGGNIGRQLVKMILERFPGVELTAVGTNSTATVIIAIAGMEGALASVIGGLADCPVTAVPTSVGYGASFHGLSALLSMLNSCASGVSVVNIDNGFGAGYLASMINHIGKKE